MSTAIIIAALTLSAGFYLLLGFRQARKVRQLIDVIPVQRGAEAAVESSGEFSASTVATTVSLATVLLAFFELAPYLGSWLIWTVVTTAMGLVVVRLACGRMWKRLGPYGERIPTIHEFLGTEYAASSLATIGALCTSLGFLGAFAVELTVGSRFFAALIPQVAPWLVVAVLAAIILVYTSAGGFRAVILTDWWQNVAIWALLLALMLYYAVTASDHGFLEAWHRVPKTTWDFSGREGLWAFLIGIFVINVPTFLSDMSMWQRVTSVRVPQAAFTGLTRSILGAACVWGLFAVIACLAPMVANPSGTENPLLDVLHHMMSGHSVMGNAVLFVVILGLYAAMLSTGSTQLVALSHAIHEDVLYRKRRQSQARSVWTARGVLLVCAVCGIVFVEVLSALEFSIADLVFAVYGAQLGLFPPTLLGLLRSRDKLLGLGPYGVAGVCLGFVGGWGAAIVGKAVGEPNLVFLAPAISLAVSAAAVGTGVVVKALRLERA